MIEKYTVYYILYLYTYTSYTSYYIHIIHLFLIKFFSVFIASAPDINARDLSNPYLKINSAWKLKVRCWHFEQLKFNCPLSIASVPSIHVNPTATRTCGLCAIPRRPPPRLTPPDYNSYRAYYPRSRSARYFCGASASPWDASNMRADSRAQYPPGRSRTCVHAYICMCIHGT